MVTFLVITIEEYFCCKYNVDIFVLQDMSMIKDRERELSEINMRQVLAERAREQVENYIYSLLYNKVPNNDWSDNKTNSVFQ